MEQSGTDEKKERLLVALERGMVMIHLDARRPGVRVPDNLRDEAHLRLNLSYRFDPPDLTVSDWGVRTSLSFSGSRFKVAVPWSALFAIASHVTQEFWMFPEDLPAELIENQQADDFPATTAPQAPAPVRRTPSLTAVAGGLSALPKPDGDDGEVDEVDDDADSDDASTADTAAPSPGLLAPVPAPAPAALRSDDGDDDAPPPSAPRPGRSHLRLVK